MEATSRTCYLCKEEKPLTKFSWAKKSCNRRQRECKDCHKLYKRQYYKSRSSAVKERALEYKKERVAEFQEFKSGVKCVVCDEDDNCCIDFHHVDPATKTFAVSSKVRDVAFSTLMDEINKCIPVCKNCHAKFHAGKISFAALV